MISLVDCALATVVAMCLGVLIGGFNRAAGRTKPESEHKSAAQQNAGPLWYFVPYQERDRPLVAPCIRYRAREYARRFRN